MGRPFAQELGRLETTVAEVASTDLSVVVDWAERSSSSPVLAVGSGGSLSVADWAAWLHEAYTGRVSRAVTPLQVVGLSRIAPGTSVSIISAGGTNSDVLGATEHVLSQEPGALLALCAKPRSPLVQRLSELEWPHVLTTQLSSGKDGFLATNSLIAFVHILARAYGQAFGSGAPVPNSLDKIRQCFTIDGAGATSSADDAFWRRDHILVLHGASTRSAAVDLESKFSEAALGSVQVADYRNFGHGRHHWLAKRGGTTAVLALIDPDVAPLAARTLRLIPRDIPRATVHLERPGVEGGLAAFLAVLEIVKAAGIARAIDPGRPGVPDFGRKLYSLGLGSAGKRTPSPRELAVRRKSEASGRPDVADLLAAHDEFVQQLGRAKIGAIVCDYDGTLCARSRRFGNDLELRIQREVRRLVGSGLVLGVATGRGRSVAQPFRNLLPQNQWDRVVVGYYNGSIVLPLADDLQEDVAHSPAPETEHAFSLLARSKRLAELAAVEPRFKQITVTPRRASMATTVWDLVHDALAPALAGIAVVRSSHSIDVLMPGVTKMALVECVQGVVRASAPDVVRIGDAGRWPGNDAQLLATDLSLSVDQVSGSPDTCWNLAPTAERGPAAAARYLRAIKVRAGIGRFALTTLEGA